MNNELVDNQNPLILVVDDSKFNRDFLARILEEDYRLIEAENGLVAEEIIQEKHSEISLILLDINMPVLDGFQVLEWLNQNEYLESLPVIMISSESEAKIINKAYDMGISDYISRPFDFRVVHHRVDNVVRLYEKQHRLVKMITNEIKSNNKTRDMMNDILSRVVEFRNSESGSHIRNIKNFTILLLEQLIAKYPQYKNLEPDIPIIAAASGLHDIGKMAIPDEVLNKPGRLTPEEFEIIKTHSKAGADLISGIYEYQNEPLIKYAYDICLSHHEKYDGKGYPNRLTGDEIPIVAQIVSIADVYDALTAERCYKKAFDRETATNMIVNGECGAFNPIILDCFLSIKDDLSKDKIIEIDESRIHKFVSDLIK